MESQILVFKSGMVASSLGLKGWRVDFCADIDNLRAKIHKQKYHSIVLTSSLEAQETLKTCKYLRSQELESPIVVLMDGVNSRSYCEFITVGADDVMPLNQTEMLNVKLNSYSTRPPVTKHKLYANQEFLLDVKTTECRLNSGMLVNLRAKEYTILKYFMERPGVVVTRDTLMLDLFEDKYVLPDTLDMHICNLRKRFKQAGCMGNIIVTVPRIGYKYG